MAVEDPPLATRNLSCAAVGARLPTNKTPAITKTRDNFMVVSSEPHPALASLIAKSGCAREGARKAQHADGRTGATIGLTDAKVFGSLKQKVSSKTFLRALSDAARVQHRQLLIA
jgi:hypothetical protein